MMADWMFAMLQATVVLTIATLIARKSIGKDPDLAARVGGLGLVLAACIPAAAWLQVPKPWSVDPQAWLPAQFFGAGTPVQSPSSQLEDDKLQDEATAVGVANTNELSPGLALFGQSLRLPTHWFLGKRYLDRTSVVVAGRFLLVALTVYLFIRVILGGIGAWWLLRTSTELQRAQWPVELRQLAAKHDWMRNIRIRTHAVIETPCVHALARRVVFVPNNFQDWTPVEIKTVIAHEAAHLFRNDPWQRLLGSCGIAMLAGHPSAWWLHRQLCEAQEMATDRRAALALNDLSEYRRGLALLCLRFDQDKASRRMRSLYSLSTVGISNRLIRRIKMLPSQAESPIRPAPVLHRTALIALTMVAFIVGGWALRADDPIRVATRPLDKVESKRADAFQRPKALPENGLATGSGLIELRPRDAAEHPILASFFSMIEGSFQALVKPGPNNQPQHLSDFGLQLTRVKKIQVIPQIEFTIDPEAEEKEHQLTMGASSFFIEANSSIDWPKLLKAVPVTALGPIDEEAWNQIADAQSVGPEFRLEGNSTKNEKALPGAEQLWQLVSGGVLTAIAPMPAALHSADFTAEAESTLEPFERETLTLFQGLASCGVGIDVHSDTPALQARVALVGAEGTSPESLEGNVKDWLQQVSDRLEAGNVASQSVARNLRLAKIETTTLAAKYPAVTISFALDPLVLATLSL